MAQPLKADRVPDAWYLLSGGVITHESVSTR